MLKWTSLKVKKCFNISNKKDKKKERKYNKAISGNF